MGRICNTCEVIVANTFFKKSVSVSVILSVRWEYHENTFTAFLMTFAALVGIHNIVCSSQYVRLQALQKIAKKNHLLKVSIFPIHLGHFIKTKLQFFQIWICRIWGAKVATIVNNLLEALMQNFVLQLSWGSGLKM